MQFQLLKGATFSRVCLCVCPHIRFLLLNSGFTTFCLCENSSARARASSLTTGLAVEIWVLLPTDPTSISGCEPQPCFKALEPGPPEIDLEGLHWSLPCCSQAFFQFKEGPHFFCLRVFAHALLRTFRLLLLSLRTRAHSEAHLHICIFLMHTPDNMSLLPNILSPSILLFSHLCFISAPSKTEHHEGRQYLLWIKHSALKLATV